MSGENGWVKCSDRLPEVGVGVRLDLGVIKCIAHITNYGRWVSGGYLIDKNYKITQWQPYSQPQKGE